MSRVASYGVQRFTPMKEPEISYVTWSAKGVRVVYTGEMVVHLSAEDMYPLAVKEKVVSLVDTERRSMFPKAS
jgi:hypothetical protein